MKTMPIYIGLPGSASYALIVQGLTYEPARVEADILNPPKSFIDYLRCPTLCAFAVGN